MDSVNKSIGCDVTECVYNAMGRNCSLDKIKVTTACEQVTCCGDFSSKF